MDNDLPVIDNWYEFGDRIWGNVSGNPKFRDGAFIHTSSIVDINEGYVQTRNTLYRLGTKYVPEGISDNG